MKRDKWLKCIKLPKIFCLFICYKSNIYLNTTYSFFNICFTVALDLTEACGKLLLMEHQAPR